MGQKVSHPTNDPMSTSSIISHPEHKNGARLDEGQMTSSALTPAAKLPKVKPATLIHLCEDCEYKTTVKKHLERHRKHHSVISAHQCQWCSFSVSMMPHLAKHVRNYHTKTDKKPLSTKKQQSKSVSKKSAEEWHYPPTSWRKRYQFNCGDCNYKSIKKLALDAHIKLMHPFSTTALKSPTLEKEKKKFHLKPASESTRGEWYVSPRGNRLRYIYCGDGEYRTTSRLNINRHAGKMHPSSATAIIPAKRPKEERAARQNHPGKKVELEKEEDVTPVNESDSSTIEHARQHASVNEPVMFHQKKTPPSQVEVMEWNSGKKMLYKKKEKSHSFQCLECDYSTSYKSNITRHKQSHQRNGKFKCSQCSFSSDYRSTISLHFKRSHRQNLNLLETAARIQEVPSEARLRIQFGIKECRVMLPKIRPLSINVSHPENRERLRPNEEANQNIYEYEDDEQEQHRNLNSPDTRNQEVRSEARLRKQFGIKECRVILLDIQPPSVIVVNPESAEELPSNEEVHQMNDDDGNQQGDEKRQLLEMRMKTIEERARIAYEEVTEFSSKKTDVQKRIDEVNGRRALIERDLRSEQLNLRELNRSALETGEEPSEILKQSVEEELKSLEDKMKLIDAELSALKEEEKSLDQDLEEARGSHFGVVQVLEALQSELDGLSLSNIRI